MNKQETTDFNNALFVCRAFVKLMDQILPQAGRLVLDIGLTNDALIVADKVIKQADHDK